MAKNDKGQTVYRFMGKEYSTPEELSAASDAYTAEQDRIEKERADRASAPFSCKVTPRGQFEVRLNDGPDFRAGNYPAMSLFGGPLKAFIAHFDGIKAEAAKAIAAGTLSTDWTTAPPSVKKSARQ